VRISRWLSKRRPSSGRCAKASIAALDTGAVEALAGVVRVVRGATGQRIIDPSFHRARVKTVIGV
jgi:hypothetical protein